MNAVNATNRSVVRELIWKDLQLNSVPLIVATVVSLLALGLMQVKREIPFFMGMIWFFVGMIVLACILPVNSVVNERKKQNLAFLMSLPVSAIQYTRAKFISTVGMYLIPYLIAISAALWVVYGRHMVPMGALPFGVILLLVPLVIFCIIASAALIFESEGWTMAATLFCNSTSWLTWYFMLRSPVMMADMKSNVIVWRPFEFWALAAEFGVTALIFGITFYVQSKKRDFI